MHEDYVIIAFYCVPVSVTMCSTARAASTGAVYELFTLIGLDDVGVTRSPINSLVTSASHVRRTLMINFFMINAKRHGAMSAMILV